MWHYGLLAAVSKLMGPTFPQMGKQCNKERTGLQIWFDSSIKVSSGVWKKAVITGTFCLMWGRDLCLIQACMGNVFTGKACESAVVYVYPSSGNLRALFYCFPNHICWPCHSLGKLIFKENTELMVLIQCLICEVFVTPQGSYNKCPYKSPQRMFH